MDVGTVELTGNKGSWYQMPKHIFMKSISGVVLLAIKNMFWPSSVFSESSGTMQGILAIIVLTGFTDESLSVLSLLSRETRSVSFFH